MVEDTPKDNSQEPELKFEDLCDAKTKRYTEDCSAGMKWRTAMAVTLLKRYMNDYHGYWDGLLSSWLDVPSQGLMKWPVLGPIVRANNANWLGTRVKLQIEAASSDPRKTGAEVVAAAVYDYLYQRDWNETNEELMSLYCQLAFNYAVYSGFSKHASTKKMKVPKVREAEVEPEAPEWYCSNCGNSGPATDLATESGQDLSGTLKCPSCGQQSAHVDEQEGKPDKIEVEDGYDEIAEGDNFTKVVPSLLFLIDETHAKAGDGSQADFFNYNRISRRYAIKALYGDAADDLGAEDGKDWLEPVKWWHALETGGTVKPDRPGLKGGGKTSDDDLLQERHWWFRPAVFGSWKAPHAYSHPCGFKIKEGQTIQEAFEAQGKEYKGLYLCTVGKKIQYIDTEDHNDCWSFGLWMMNGASFYGKAQQELLDIQEAANEWFTMFFEYGERASMPQTIASRQLFNRKDFDNRAGGIILTKKGYNLQKPISSQVMRLEPGRLSPDLMSIFLALKDGAQEISGVSRAAVGLTDASNKTLGGQELLTQRSSGLMIPSQKSKKRAQILWTRQQLKFAQKHWPDERLKEVLSKSDKSWDDENIIAFREMDLDRDLNIYGVEGSDIPITFHEKAQNLIGVVASGVLWNPQVPIELRVQIARYANIDFDPENIETERRHQLEVLRKIEAGCKWVEKEGMGYVQAEGGALDLNPQAVQRIQTLPGCEILPRAENVDFALNFFKDYVLALHSAEHPDQLLLAVLSDRIDKLMLAKAQNLQTAAITAGAIAGQTGAATAATSGGGAGDAGQAAQPEDPEAEHGRAKELAEQKHGHQKEIEGMKMAHQEKLEAMKAQAAQDGAMNEKVPAAAP